MQILTDHDLRRIGMEIVAFSDLHRGVEAARAVLEAANTADVVVGAGDFATRGVGAADTLDVLRGMRCPLVLVHGNHDDPEELRRITDDWPNAHLLHGAGVVIDGVTFFGLGGEVPSRNEAPWNASETEDTASLLLATCPDGAILVTHTPPLGHCDLQRDETHEGSQAVLDCVSRTKPRHVLSGHIHHAWGMRSEVGTTTIANIEPAAITVRL